MIILEKVSNRGKLTEDVQVDECDIEDFGCDYAKWFYCLLLLLCFISCVLFSWVLIFFVSRFSVLLFLVILFFLLIFSVLLFLFFAAQLALFSLKNKVSSVISPVSK